MNKHDAVEQLLRKPGLRRALYAPAIQAPGIATGFDTLDEALPGGGWPRGAVIEILSGHQGIGELSLLLPSLGRLSRDGQWITWVAPPHIPYAPALSLAGVDLCRVLVIQARGGVDQLWALEQALASGSCGAVLAWLDEVDGRILRRLQLAAEAGDALGFLFRPPRVAVQPSPAALRLGLAPGRGLQVEVLKCRGRAGTTLQLDTGHAVAEPLPAGPGQRHPLPRHAH